MSHFVTPIVLLIGRTCSDVRGRHLNTAEARDAVLASWGIAFFEYWLAVPANRIGASVYAPAQLKAMQEVITLVVFAGFSALYLGHPLGPNQYIGFGFIALGAFFVPLSRQRATAAGDRRSTRPLSSSVSR